MGSRGTFGEYLQARGFDMVEVHKKYTDAMKLYEENYPEEFMSWRTKQRILGND